MEQSQESRQGAGAEVLKAHQCHHGYQKHLALKTKEKRFFFHVTDADFTGMRVMWTRSTKSTLKTKAELNL